LGPLSFARSADDPGCDCDAGSQTTCLERGVGDTHAHASLECEVIVQLVLQRREVGFRRVAGCRELLPAKRKPNIRILSALTSQDKSTHSANPTGESLDFWKSIVLYATPPDVMSGTPGATCTYGRRHLVRQTCYMVERTFVLQVTAESAGRPSATSAGSATLPVTKHGFVRFCTGAVQTWLEIFGAQLGRGSRSPADTRETTPNKRARTGLTNMVSQSMTTSRDGVKGADEVDQRGGACPLRMWRKGEQRFAEESNARLPFQSRRLIRRRSEHILEFPTGGKRKVSSHGNRSLASLSAGVTAFANRPRPLPPPPHGTSCSSVQAGRGSRVRC
jgi:hypothetical protein